MNKIQSYYGKNFTIHIENDMKPRDYFYSLDWNTIVLEGLLFDKKIITIKEYIEGIYFVKNFRPNMV